MRETIRIVIADGDRTQCRWLQEELLKSPGLLTVAVETDGQQVVNRVCEHGPDILVMGIILGRWDGYEVLRTLRTMCLPRVPRVLVRTTLPMAEVQDKAYALGADRVISKTEGLTELAAMIFALCEAAPALAQGLFEQRAAITRELLTAMGMPNHLKGYVYLTQAVCDAAADPLLVSQMMDKLYPRLAQAYQTHPYSVERAIRHAIERTWTFGDMAAIERIFGNSIDPQRGKPTNGECIAMLSQIINAGLLANGGDLCEP